MRIDDIKNDLKYGFFILDRAGISEANMDKIRSIAKNNGPEQAEAINLIYAEEVN